MRFAIHSARDAGRTPDRSGGIATGGRRPPPGRCYHSRGEAAFTLAEVLAALLFMAIVIPVAVRGLQIATVAGEVAQRKASAARVAERILNETLASTNRNQTSQSGSLTEGMLSYRWALRNEVWNQSTTNQSANLNQNRFGSGQPTLNQSLASQIAMNLLSVEVLYSVQGREYSVRLSTLASSQ